MQKKVEKHCTRQLRKQ